MSSTTTYKCPNCDAGLKFDPEKQKFSCEFCLSDFVEGELSIESPETVDARERAEQEYNSRMNEYHCPNCGADIAADENTAADYCYFCHNPVVLVGKLSGNMRPDKVIPFKFDKKGAEERFLKYAKKKWFVPSDFFSKKHADKITGIYFPFWVTDADTQSSLSAIATKVRKWRSGDYMYTETSRFKVYREGDIHFEDIVTSAITDADKQMLEGVLPYPIDSYEDFSIPYLLGFNAKKRDIDRDALVPEVRDRMSQYASALLRNTIMGYTTVMPEAPKVKVHKSHWEYSLMPIWILTYTKKGKKDKVYTYAMNGYTEKMYGELPISFGKISLLFGAVCAAAATVMGLVGGFLL